MSNFWPDDLKLTDTESPTQILMKANEDWKQNSQGRIELIMQTGETQSGHDIIVVHARDTSSFCTATIFSLVMRKGQPYPTRLQPEEIDLPNAFKKTVVFGGITGELSQRFKTLSDTITPQIEQNRWLADTPSELRQILREFFNSGIVKSTILNLVASNPEPNEVANAMDSADRPQELLDGIEEAE